MDFEDERLGAESFCTLLIASLDEEISDCCEFKGLGELTILPTIPIIQIILSWGISSNFFPIISKH